MERAVKSALAVLKSFDNPPKIKIDEDLQDVDHSGIKDKTISWLERSGADLYNLPDLKGKIEDQEQMALRIIDVLRQIVRNHLGETIFVSSHGDPMAYALWRLRFPKTDFPIRKEMLRINHLKKGRAWKIHFDASANILAYDLLSPD